MGSSRVGSDAVADFDVVGVDLRVGLLADEVGGGDLGALLAGVAAVDVAGHLAGLAGARGEDGGGEREATHDGLLSVGAGTLSGSPHRPCETGGSGSWSAALQLLVDPVALQPVHGEGVVLTTGGGRPERRLHPGG